MLVRLLARSLAINLQFLLIRSLPTKCMAELVKSFYATMASCVIVHDHGLLSLYVCIELFACRYTLQTYTVGHLSFVQVTTDNIIRKASFEPLVL